MLDFDSQKNIYKDIYEVIKNNKNLLDKLRKDISELKNNVQRIQPRSATSIALVGTDGGNNKFKFDPFLIQVIRIVDSSNNELFLNVVSSEMNINDLNKLHLDKNGNPKDAVGELMKDLGLSHISELSHMLKTDSEGKATNSGWINDYRNIIEWAILYKILTKMNYDTDTLIMFDGLFRTKVFWPKVFKSIIEKIKLAIKKHKKQKRNLYVVGIAKHSQILVRYRLVMLLENILNTSYPAYVEVPPNIEEKVYKYDEWITPSDDKVSQGEFSEYSAGRMFLTKFGPKPYDPIWAVDVFVFQKNEIQKIMGFLLADAINGFPVPYYPLALQEAHNNAALVDFDYNILQTYIYKAVRNILEEDGNLLDIYNLIDTDPSSERY